MKIVKKNRNDNPQRVLYEREDHMEVKRRRYSYLISIGCFLALLVCFTFYIVKRAENIKLEQKIEELKQSSDDISHSEQMVVREELIDAFARAKDYRNVSRQFWEQLITSERVTGEYQGFFDKEMEDVLGEGNLLDQIVCRGNEIQITGRMIEEGQSAAYAKHLEALKDSDGNPRFVDVVCQDAPRLAGYYKFEMKLVLWEVLGGVS